MLLAVVESPGIERALADGETVVFVNRRPSAAVGQRFVGIDNVAAAREVADHLLCLGCKRLAVIHGPLHSSATVDRVAGFRRRVGEIGANLPAYRIASSGGLDHLDIGYRTMARLFAADRKIDGVFCSSDLIAFGARRRLIEVGVRVPEDIAMVGFDGSPLNDWIAPWLVSVRVPYDTFGSAIAAMINGRVQVPVEKLLPHRLVTRQQS